MKNRKQLLADFYLELLKMKAPTAPNNLLIEVLRELAIELESDMSTVKHIFERMAAEDGK